MRRGPITPARSLALRTLAGWSLVIPARSVARRSVAGRWLAVVVVAVLLVGVPLAAGAVPAGATSARPAAPLGRQTVVHYVEPVDAPVVDRFRPPATPYGAGNRGWEYAPEVGTVVRAAADGTVAFAGPVGGTVAVTVAHADGLRTSYSYLDAASVVAGDVVRQGDPLGRSGSRLHFGVRRGEVYLDPALLFAPSVARRVRLVPLLGPPPGSNATSGPATLARRPPPRGSFAPAHGRGPAASQRSHP